MKTLIHHFSDLVETVYGLPLEDKIELRSLLDHNIIQNRRTEIASNYLKTREEEKSDLLRFSSDISELKNML